MSAIQGMRRANPFVGPRPFQRNDRLFGREREVRDLRDLLLAERIVVLYSPSGAGKTSLIHAGLIPVLEQEGLTILPVIRVNQPPLAVPAARPNRYVLSAILSLERGLPDGDQSNESNLDQLTLGEFLAQRPPADGEPANDLLIFDQFEEILTLDPTDGPAKTEFFAQVGEVLRTGERKALFSLREDYLAGLDPYRRRIPTGLTTTFRLSLLTPTAALQSIQSTSAAAGVEFTEAAARLLIEDLGRVRLQQPDGTVAERAGSDIEPVQLQVVCHRLWNQLPADTNRIGPELVAAFGTISGALSSFYAESVAAVALESGDSERDIRTWFDEHLITKHGIRGQVLWEHGQTGELDSQTVRLLIDRHLVRAESRRGATWLELAHDRLIDPVRADNDAWFRMNLSPLQQQARLWLDQDRAPDYLLAGAALTDAEQWAADHPESLSVVDRQFLDEAQRQRALQEAKRREHDLGSARLRATEAQARQEAEESARQEAERRAVEAARRETISRRRLVLVGLGALATGVAIGAAIVSR